MALRAWLGLPRHHGRNGRRRRRRRGDGRSGREAPTRGSGCLRFRFGRHGGRCSRFRHIERRLIVVIGGSAGHWASAARRGPVLDGTSSGVFGLRPSRAAARLRRALFGALAGLSSATRARSARQFRNASIFGPTMRWGRRTSGRASPSRTRNQINGKDRGGRVTSAAPVIFSRSNQVVGERRCRAGRWRESRRR